MPTRPMEQPKGGKGFGLIPSAFLFETSVPVRHAPRNSETCFVRIAHMNVATQRLPSEN
jgi:hypothetical protein